MGLLRWLRTWRERRRRRAEEDRRAMEARVLLTERCPLCGAAMRWITPTLIVCPRLASCFYELDLEAARGR